VSCHRNNFFFITIGVLPVELSAYQVLMVSAANLSGYFNLYIRRNIDLSVSFAYFTHFLNLNISGTNTYICKR